MSMDRTITVEVKLDRKTFRDFALFDTFVLKKHWVRPAVFCAAMTLFAVIALIFVKEQPWLISGVLFAAGAGLPAVYILSFLSQVNIQAKKNRLSAERSVYTVVLRDDGVTVRNCQRENETLTLKWSDVAVYFRKKCIYLYAGSGKAFLLPDGQADVPAGELREFISGRCRNQGN